MLKFKNAIRTCMIYAAVVLLAGGVPMTAMAETVDSAPPAVTDTTATPAPTLTPEKEKERYTFNPETNHWDSNRWAYNPATGKYEAVVMPSTPVEQAPVSNELPSASSGTDGTQSSSTVNAITDATINNTLDSDATTGNAAVKQNTTGGNATTGDATAIANVMNMINSSVSTDGAQFATFVTDVVGDVHGDIMLYPMLIAAMLQAANNPGDSTVAVNNDAQINNNINLNATTGNADVKTNTTAGNATTGAANTVANVMNIINSIIAANQSFVGTINIHGNLDGDILVAPDFFPQLLASNGGSSAPTNSLAVSSEDTQSILNNIDLNAASGNAIVANNTTAGSATTGDAKTNIVLLNLTGHQIVAKDSMLVFVNVLGQWVGMIVGAPEGSTAAAIGNGVVSNNIAPDLTIDVNNNSRIVNNLNLNSQSGNATVTDNTTAGNATTGNATASANVANVSGSQVGLTGWFGVLFINVFKNWFGSFGIDTAAGNPVTPGMGGTDTAPPTTAQPFQFIPRSDTPRRTAAPAFNSQRASNQPAVATEEVIAGTQSEDDDKVALAPYVPSAGATAQKSPVVPSGDDAQVGMDFLPLIGSAVVLGLGAVLTRLVIAVIRGRGLAA